MNRFNKLKIHSRCYRFPCGQHPYHLQAHRYNGATATGMPMVDGVDGYGNAHGGGRRRRRRRSRECPRRQLWRRLLDSANAHGGWRMSTATRMRTKAATSTGIRTAAVTRMLTAATTVMGARTVATTATGMAG